jgi:hypothetical protein
MLDADNKDSRSAGAAGDGMDWQLAEGEDAYG